MMKKVTIIGVLLIICFASVLCFFIPCRNGRTKKKAIEEINRNCDVPYALTLPETELKDTDAYSGWEGFGCYGLANDDVLFTLSGYPDCLDAYHVTAYEIRTTKYTLMGLRVGCSLDAADKVMGQHGYAISSDDHGLSRYTKSGVRVGVDLEDGIITALRVSVEVTNKKGVQF